MISRRDFLKYAGIAGAAAALPLKIGVRSAQAFSQSMPLSKFAQAMRIFGGTGLNDIPLAATKGTPYAGVDYYEITAGPFTQQLHPSLPATGTRLFGYTDGIHSHTHLGAPILATQGKPVRIKFTNLLPDTAVGRIVPFDATITQGLNITTPTEGRSAIHLHGGLVPWISDGGPFHWLKSGVNTQSGVANPNTDGRFGASVIDWLPKTLDTLTNDYFYPNNQSPRFMWYHDHAIGITRTNAYSGVATGYLVTDFNEQGLIAQAGVGIVMVFQDKIFYDGIQDPGYKTYVPSAQPGDLWYPYLYEKNRWKLLTSRGTLAPPIPSCIPEFFGDTMLVNGTVYPFHNVNKGRYRLRLLNACNARFLNLSFAQEDPKVPGEPLLNNKGLPVGAPVDVWMVGTEGGFLDKPVQIFLNGNPINPDGTAFVPTPTNPGPLLVAPAERPDLIVDFSKCVAVAPATTYNVILYNDAQAPFPAGSPLNDYFYSGGKPNATGATKAGFGPNTRTPMMFKVSNASGPSITLPTTGGVILLPTVLDPNGGLALDTTKVTVARTDNLTLNENFDAWGRLQQLVGTNVLPNPAVPGAFGRAYLDAPTEQVNFGGIYIWNVFNLTADTHPMHVHEFNAMILQRRLFDAKNFTGTPVYLAPGVGPSPTETGWKETFKMNPGECTVLAILVEDPLPVDKYPRGSYTIPGTEPPATVQRPTVVVRDNAGSTIGTGTLPVSPRLLTYNPRVIGDEYVWHCHILEHEEHDMMRPLVCHYPGA